MTNTTQALLDALRRARGALISCNVREGATRGEGRYYFSEDKVKDAMFAINSALAVANAAPVQQDDYFAVHVGQDGAITDLTAGPQAAPVLDVADERVRFEVARHDAWCRMSNLKGFGLDAPRSPKFDEWFEAGWQAALSQPIAKDEPVAGLAFVEHPDGTMTGLIAATNNQLTTLGKEQLIKAARDLGLPPITIE